MPPPALAERLVEETKKVFHREFSTGLYFGRPGQDQFTDAEDSSAPLSDEKIAVKMKEAGIPVARRTVAKYRGLLGIGGVSERRALK